MHADNFIVEVSRNMQEGVCMQDGRRHNRQLNLQINF